MIDDRNLKIIENLLDWTSKRQQALSSNVTNMDTPGYRAKDFSFSEQLGMMGVNATAAGHIVPSQDNSSARVYEVGTKEKANGNTVDLERELTEITKNGLQYITMVQYLNQKLRTLRSAIKDGGAI
jgi:flagellar basal-body rod protein FlgB